MIEIIRNCRDKIASVVEEGGTTIRGASGILERFFVRKQKMLEFHRFQHILKSYMGKLWFVRNLGKSLGGALCLSLFGPI